MEETGMDGSSMEETPPWMTRPWMTRPWRTTPWRTTPWLALKGWMTTRQGRQDNGPGELVVYALLAGGSVRIPKTNLYAT